MKRILFATICLLSAYNLFAQSDIEIGQIVPLHHPGLSPLNYGYDTATSGISRYQILYNTHTAAIEKGVNVSYYGLDTVHLEIPPEARPIPLTKNNNFNNVVFSVLNTAKHQSLFSMQQSSQSISLSKEVVEELDFSNIPELKNGSSLLILGDSTPWVGERLGYGYPVYRSDVLLIQNGISSNSPIASYNTDATRLHCRFIPVTDDQKTIENFTLLRHPESTHKTYGVSVNYQNNILLRNINIHTPKSKMIADAAISVNNSTHVTMEDITIRGTYSGYGRFVDYGYGIAMNNIWNATFVRVDATGNWGVFGTNNMSNVKLIDSKLNRFDIHCYGKDAHCIGCHFIDKQTQFSSMFGKVQFDSCTFVDCIPLRIRSSYNAYTPFEIEMNDCTFEITYRNKSLVNVMLLDTNINSRPELSEKCWPNLTINNLNVIAPPIVRKVYLFDPTGNTKECRKPVGYISKIEANNVATLNRKGKPIEMKVVMSRIPFATKKELSLIINQRKP